MKKAALVIARGGDTKTLFEGDSRDNCNHRFRLLKKELNDLGVIIKSDDEIESSEVDIYIFIDANNEKLKKLSRNSKKLLVIGESPIINRNNHYACIRNQYDRVLSWESNTAKHEKVFWLGCGCSYPEKYSLVEWGDYNREKKICMISGNKKSSMRQELYTERTKAVKELNKYGMKVDLYGPGWNKRKFRGLMRPLNKIKLATSFIYEPITTYRGRCDSKFQTMKHYRFTLCYENARTENGYISEKIFDAMFSGSIPIYLGAKNVNNFIPSNTFINRNEFKDYRSLAIFLQTMNEQDYQRYYRAIKEYAMQFKETTFYEIGWAKTIAQHTIDILKGKQE